MHQQDASKLPHCGFASLGRPASALIRADPVVAPAQTPQSQGKCTTCLRLGKRRSPIRQSVESSCAYCRDPKPYSRALCVRSAAFQNGPSAPARRRERAKHGIQNRICPLPSRVSQTARYMSMRRWYTPHARTCAGHAPKRIGSLAPLRLPAEAPLLSLPDKPFPDARGRRHRHRQTRQAHPSHGTLPVNLPAGWTRPRRHQRVRGALAAD